MMMMMIMIAGLVDSVTTPIKCWLDGHRKSTNTRMKEKEKEECVCVVCLSEVCLGERYAILERCSHGFHVECVEAWLKDHPNCPLCRTPMYENANHSRQISTVYLKRSYEIISGRVLEMMASWLTTSGDLQSTLSESCRSYL